MVAVRKDLIADLGGTLTFSYMFKDSNGVPVDLSYWSGDWRIYNYKGVMIYGDGLAIENPGRITAYLGWQDLASLSTKENLSYAVFMTNPNDEPFKHFYGKLTVRDGIV